MSKVAFQRAFQELLEDEVDEVMAGAEKITFPAGARIMREGEDNDRIYVILEGSVRVVRLERGGHEIRIAVLGPGDTFGEMSFVDSMGASATLVADTKVVAKGADRRLIDQIAAGREAFMERFYLSLLHTVIRRLRRLDALDHRLRVDAVAVMDVVEA